MNFGIYISLFCLSMVKFMFTPFAGPAAKMTFLETYVVCVSGAIVSAAFFYYMSEFFMKRTHNKRVKLRHEAMLKGTPFPEKKKFTKLNKLVVKTKRSMGIYGIAMYAPFFFSVPIGSIISAKFYGKEKKTFPLIILGMIVNGLITTGISYLLKDLFLESKD